MSDFTYAEALKTTPAAPVTFDVTLPYISDWAEASEADSPRALGPPTKFLGAPQVTQSQGSQHSRAQTDCLAAKPDNPNGAWGQRVPDARHAATLSRGGPRIERGGRTTPERGGYGRGPPRGRYSDVASVSRGTQYARERQAETSNRADFTNFHSRNRRTGDQRFKTVDGDRNERISHRGGIAPRGGWSSGASVRGSRAQQGTRGYTSNPIGGSPVLDYSKPLTLRPDQLYKLAGFIRSTASMGFSERVDADRLPAHLSDNFRAVPVEASLEETYKTWRSDYDQRMEESAVNENPAGLAWMNGNHKAASELCNNDPTVVCFALATDPEMSGLLRSFHDGHRDGLWRTFAESLEFFSERSQGFWQVAPRLVTATTVPASPEGGAGALSAPFRSWWHYVAFRFILQPFWEGLDGVPDDGELDGQDVSGSRADQDIQAVSTTLMDGGTLRTYVGLIAAGERSPLQSCAAPLQEESTFADPLASVASDEDVELCSKSETGAAHAPRMRLDTSDSDDDV